MMDCVTINVKGFMMTKETNAIQNNQPMGDERPYVDYTLPAEQPLPITMPPPPPHQAAKKDVAPIKRYWLMLLVAFLLALGIDLLVFEQAFGKQFAIIVNAIMVGALVLSLTEKRKIPWQSYPLMAMVSASSILTVFRTEPYTNAALIIFVLIGLSLLMASMLSGQWVGYRIRETIKRHFFFGIHTMIGLPRSIVEMNKNKADAPKSKKVLQTVGTVLLGVAIAIPLLLIFGRLLGSADSQFAANIKAFLDLFRFYRFEKFWPQLFLVLFFFWGIAGALYYMLSRSHGKERLEPDEALVSPFLAHTAAMVALALVSVMFLVFIVGQWAYFFGGAANIAIDGHTYSSYATSGFRELMVAASIAAVVHYLFSSMTKRETKLQKVSFSVLATLLLVLVGLMLVSAFQRLLLYEAAYGFTRDRLVAHVFMIFLALILVVLAVMEISRNLKRLALVLLVSSFLFGITLAAVNVDKTITRLNINQATLIMKQEHKTSSRARFDGSYLALSMGEEAIPELYRHYLMPEQPEEMRENLAKVLACRSLKVEDQDPPGKWHTYKVPEKAEFDFFATHAKSLTEAFPPEKEECVLGYTINGEFISCKYVCLGR